MSCDASRRPRPARRGGLALSALLALSSLVLPAGAARAQGAGAAPAPPHPSESPEARLERLEKEVAALRAELARLASGGEGGDKARLAEVERRLDILAQEIERLRLGEEVAGATAAERGMGPAASKIYRTQRGVSIGGYGELLYEHFRSRLDDGAPAGESARLDLLRGVVYVGYKWTDRWLLNSELEWEHANTHKGGEAAVEFAYVDYRWRPALSLRGGLLLMPVGFLNELHEPTTFLGARRPDVESFLIPTTWRESGVGLYGEAGPFSYRAYLTGGLDATGFSAGEGLAEGSAEGSQAKADDLAGVARLDWTALPGLVAGFSAYHGGAGQGLTDESGRRLHIGTTLVEAHAEWRYRGLEARALGARASIADAAALDRIRGLEGAASIGSRLSGGYLQVGYDLFSLFPRGEQSLIPFVRYERTNTQAAVPAGFRADPANDSRSWTVGLSYKPIPQVVLKADYQDYDNRAGTGLDRVNLALGWIF
jgi:hypothetical protein